MELVDWTGRFELIVDLPQFTKLKNLFIDTIRVWCRREQNPLIRRGVHISHFLPTTLVHLAIKQTNLDDEVMLQKYSDLLQCYDWLYMAMELFAEGILARLPELTTFAFLKPQTVNLWGPDQGHPQTFEMDALRVSRPKGLFREGGIKFEMKWQ